MTSTKKEIELQIRVGVLEKLVDNLISRVDEANVKSAQAESLVKQVIEAVQKVQNAPAEKDEWDDAPTPPEIPDELTMFTGMEKKKEEIKQ